MDISPKSFEENAWITFVLIKVSSLFFNVERNSDFSLSSSGNIC